MSVDLCRPLFNAGGDEEIQQSKYRGFVVSDDFVACVDSALAPTGVAVASNLGRHLLLLDDARRVFADARLHPRSWASSKADELLDGGLDGCAFRNILYAV